MPPVAAGTDREAWSITSATVVTARTAGLPDRSPPALTARPVRSRSVAQQALSEELVGRLRRRFGSEVARAMGYPKDRAASLAKEFIATIDGPNVSLRFDWCGRQQAASWDGDEQELEAQVVAFALGVADDLKEHRGRHRRALPWDELSEE